VKGLNSWLLAVFVGILVVAFGGWLAQRGEDVTSPASSPQVTEDRPSAKEPPVNTQKADEKETDKKHIPGLTAADIKVNLEQDLGFHFTGPEMRQTFAVDHGEGVDSTTGVKLICDIYESSPMAIQWVEFMVDGSGVAGSINPALFNAVAEGYFGYVATLPYEGADPEKAKAWVKANVKTANKQGKVLTTVIGPVKYELYGMPWFRTLEVKPAQAE
jgi:hypothetical protein